MCVLRFVRREKEIAMTQCEASEEEALRHKQRAEHQNREIMELQEALNAEREKMQVRNRIENWRWTKKSTELHFFKPYLTFLPVEKVYRNLKIT